MIIGIKAKGKIILSYRTSNCQMYLTQNLDQIHLNFEFILLI
jgi:hypothetical protein